MIQNKDFDITIDSSFLAAFRSMSMEMYKVFREFIDNSLQSYLDHREVLDSLPSSPKTCVVEISWDSNEISIRDNSFGMDEEAFKRALKLGQRAPGADEKDGLSKFGVGLKTAACYASSDYIIESVAYGSGIKFYTELDIDFIKSNSPKTNSVDITDCLKNEHGTRILLKRINPNCTFKAATLKKVKATLSRIYFFAIQNGNLSLSINGELLRIQEPELYKDFDPQHGWNGNEVYAPVGNIDGFLFQGKRYRYEGWIGALLKGDSSGARSGFDYFQADRAIMLSQHPEALFKSKNDARFQHVYGMIKLIGTEWPISFNKDQILWGDQGLLEAFISDLNKNADAKRVFDSTHDTKYRTPKGVKIAPVIPPKNSNGQTSTPGSNSGVSSLLVPPEESALTGAVYFESTSTLLFHDYSFEFKIMSKHGERGEVWLKLIDCSPLDHGAKQIKASIEINIDTPFFSDINNQKAIYKFAQLYIAARIMAAINGLALNKSLILDSALNDIVGNCN